MIEVPANTAPVHVQPWAIPHAPAEPPENQLVPSEGVLAAAARFLLKYMGAPKSRPDEHGVV